MVHRQPPGFGSVLAKMLLWWSRRSRATSALLRRRLAVSTPTPVRSLSPLWPSRSRIGRRRCSATNRRSPVVRLTSSAVLLQCSHAQAVVRRQARRLQQGAHLGDEQQGHAAPGARRGGLAQSVVVLRVLRMRVAASPGLCCGTVAVAAANRTPRRRRGAAATMSREGPARTLGSTIVCTCSWWGVVAASHLSSAGSVGSTGPLTGLAWLVSRPTAPEPVLLY